MSLDPARLADLLLPWFDAHGRHDLPWQAEPTPYRVWVSEVMLQQTQVDTVKPYFERFVARFPDPATLAAAPADEVMRHWSGLGYYARARNLHRAAAEIVARHDGALPDTLDALIALPGIGRSTAGAILALACGQSQPILDGNVKRVLARVFLVDDAPDSAAGLQKLWSLAEAATPQQRVAAYTQAIMDLGATVCTRANPACTRCPLAGVCAALAAGRTDAIPVARRRARRERTHGAFRLPGRGGPRAARAPSAARNLGRVVDAARIPRCRGRPRLRGGPVWSGRALATPGARPACVHSFRSGDRALGGRSRHGCGPDRRRRSPLARTCRPGGGRTARARGKIARGVERWPEWFTA